MALRGRLSWAGRAAPGDTRTRGEVPGAAIGRAGARGHGQRTQAALGSEPALNCQ